MPDCDPLNHLGAVAARPGDAPPDPIGHASPPVSPSRHVNHIIGRVTRHSGAQNVTVKRATVPLRRCRKVAAQPAGTMRPAHVVQAALLPRIVPGVAAITAVTGGSGILGGFGLTSNAPHPAVCIGTVCNTGIPLPEPASALLLGIATLLVLTLRAAGQPCCGSPKPNEQKFFASFFQKRRLFLKKRSKKLLLIKV